MAGRFSRVADEPTVLDTVEREYEPIQQQLDADLATLTRRWTGRYKRYSTAFEAAARAKAAELSIEAPIEFRTVTDPDSAYSGPDNTGYDDDALAFQLWEHAREVVPMELLMTDDQEQV